MVLAAGVTEAVLRAIDVSFPKYYIHQPDRTYGWSTRPDVAGVWTEEGRAPFVINHDGFRGRAYALAKPPHVFRIAVVGDSFAEALEVPVEESFPAQIERDLGSCDTSGRARPVEVLNFGVAGYGTAQELLVLENRVWQYAPDLVVLALFPGNDLQDNWSASGDRLRPFFRLESHRLVLDTTFTQSAEFRSRTGVSGSLYSALVAKLRVLQLARRAFEPRRVESRAGADGIDARIFEQPSPPDIENGWDVTEALVAAARDSATAHHAAFLLVSIAAPIQVHPDRSIREQYQRAHGFRTLLAPEERLQQFAREARIDILPLAVPFQRYAEDHSAYLHGFKETGLGIGHWNAQGHALAGRLIADRVCGEAGLP